MPTTDFYETIGCVLQALLIENFDNQIQFGDIVVDQPMPYP